MGALIFILVGYLVLYPLSLFVYFKQINEDKQRWMVLIPFLRNYRLLKLANLNFKWFLAADWLVYYYIIKKYNGEENATMALILQILQLYVLTALLHLLILNKTEKIILVS